MNGKLVRHQTRIATLFLYRESCGDGDETSLAVEGDRGEGQRFVNLTGKVARHFSQC
jgi:hypothetical protein